MKDKREELLALAEKAVAFGSKHVDQIEVYMQDTFNTEAELQIGQINSANRSQDAGAAIRCLVGKRLGCAFTNKLDQATIQKAVKQAIAAAKSSTEDATLKSFPTKAQYPKVSGTWDEAILEKDSSVFVDLLAETSQKAATQSEGGIVGQAGVGSVFGWSAYANSLGVGAADRTTVAYIYIVLLAPTPTGMTPGILEVDVKRSFNLDLDRVVNDAVKYLQVAKNPAEGETGPKTVVFTGNALGTLLFFALLPSVRGDGIVREKSRIADKLGDKIASESLSFLDDGLRPGAWATSLFDHEGVPRQSTPVIEKGKLKSFIWDTYWANRHGVESTGNASRNMRTGVISIQPSTLVVPQGKGSLDDLISDIADGYLVSGLQGAHSSNQDTGDFSVVANPCFRIIDGELTGCINGQMVSGSAFDLIQKVDKLAGDSRQFLLPGGTAIHGPSISFSDIQVVAKES